MTNHFAHFEFEVQHSLLILSRLYYKHSKNGVRLYFQSVLGSKRGVSSMPFSFNCLVNLHLNLVSSLLPLFPTRIAKQITNQMIECNYVVQLSFCCTSKELDSTRGYFPVYNWLIKANLERCRWNPPKLNSFLTRCGKWQCTFWRIFH